MRITTTGRKKKRLKIINMRKSVHGEQIRLSPHKAINIQQFPGNVTENDENWEKINFFRSDKLYFLDTKPCVFQ